MPSIQGCNSYSHWLWRIGSLSLISIDPDYFLLVGMEGDAIVALV